MGAAHDIRGAHGRRRPPRAPHRAILARTPPAGATGATDRSEDDFHMLISLRTAALVLGLATAPFAAAAQTAAPTAAPSAEAVTKTQMGAWSLVCAQAGAPCLMEQTGAGPDGNDLVKAQLRKIDPQETPQGTVDTVFTVFVPLGVLLKAGLAVRIDGGEELRGPYDICDRNGCVLQTVLPAAMVAQMKKGVTAKFTMIAPPNKEMASSLSLSGFTAAYGALKK
jgi:invasion protein IalB